VLKKNDVIGFYRFVVDSNNHPPVGCQDIPENSINWVIPDFGIGSGGHLNIFRFILQLERLGFKNRICIVGHHQHRTAEGARTLIREHFFPVEAEVVLGMEHLPPAWYTFATSWITAYHVRSLSNTVRKLYFVQDFEPYFYAHGSEYEFAEETYKFGFLGVTAGSWLSKKLSTEYGMTTIDVGFSFDKDLYKQSVRREPHIRRVFCYCRPPTVRRGFETAMLALDIVGRKLPDVKFIFAGWDMSGYEFPHEHLNAGILSLTELPDLYSQCDAALVLSFTNLSLLPLELMACGCVVVSNDGKNTEWLLNQGNSMLCRSTPENLANGLIELLETRDYRETLAKNAKEFARTTSWEVEARKLADFLVENR